MTVPTQPTTFIGRESELDEITALLADPACRLLTLVGPGGIGKTRLGVAAAARLEVASEFIDGVHFVALQAVNNPLFLIAGISDAAGCGPGGQSDPELHILNCLEGKHLLLVLDNFEHLLPRATLLSKILAASPNVKLLVTSQEVLNLQEEWLFRVQGLEFPTNAEDGLAGEDYGAIQLFIDRARRMRHDFAPEDERDAIAMICRLVDGLPLALELAASWVKSLGCAEIAAEIERNLDFLSTPLRNVPERHRKIQAVFTHAWERLTDAERTIFERLTVFQGGFELAAAERVAGATPASLMALVDKSLLFRDADGRYQMHGLLRQFGAAQLAANVSETADEQRERHAAFYAEFLRQRDAAIISERQQQVLLEITLELDNVRAAWDWMVERGQVEQIRESYYAYAQFCDFLSHYQESANAFTRAIERLQQLPGNEERDLAIAELTLWVGWNDLRLGELNQSQNRMESADAIFTRLGIEPPPGFGTDPLVALGTLANTIGEYERAAALGEQARQVNETRGDKLNLQLAYYVLANAAYAQGDYETAWYHSRQAYRLAQETHNRWFMAYVQNDLGNIARAMGDYQQAEHYHQASYTIREAYGDPEGMAVALSHQAKTAWLQHDYPRAARLYEQSKKIYRKINDRGGLATVLHGLGDVACARGDYALTRQHLHEALEISVEMQFLPLILAVVGSTGRLLARIGQTERGIELLAEVLQHPASGQETRDDTRRSLDAIKAQVQPALFDAAYNNNQDKTLDEIATELLTEFALLDLPTGQPAAEAAKPQSLVDALTARELEVLQLIALGRSNREIADELIIAIGTVKSYTNQIYGKLGVRSRTQAVARARELQLL